MFAKPVLDAVWASDDEIVVCGESCIESYRVDLPDSADVLMTSPDSFTTTGARNLTLHHAFETDRTWEKVRYDSHNRVLAVIATADDAIIVLGHSPSGQWVPLPGFPASDSPALKQVSALAFDHSPVDASSPLQPLRLATSHHTGMFNIFAITSDSCTPLQTLSISHPAVQSSEAALALSWSPDGTYLAVASDETIKVWNPDFPFSPVLSWRASPEHWLDAGADAMAAKDLDRDSGMGDDADADMDVQTVNEPSLAWDAKGASLVFAVGRNMAVVRLLA